MAGSGTLWESPPPISPPKRVAGAEPTRSNWQSVSVAAVTPPRYFTGLVRVTSQALARVSAEKAQSLAPKMSKKKSAILAAIAPPEDAEFKSKMSIAMKAAWARRKKAVKSEESQLEKRCWRVSGQKLATYNLTQGVVSVWG